jgi:hypothetical protein
MVCKKKIQILLKKDAFGAKLAVFETKCSEIGQTNTAIAAKIAYFLFKKIVSIELWWPSRLIVQHNVLDHSQSIY